MIPGRTNPKATLILGGPARIAVPVARSLARHGIRVCYGPIQGGPPKAHSRAIRGPAFPVLDPDSTELPAVFLERLQREQVDYLIPGSDTALVLVARHYSELSRYCTLACPGPAAIRRVLDKNLTLEIAARIGIPIPHQVAPGGTPDWPVGELRFPVVAKPAAKFADAEFKTRYCDSPESLRELASGIPGFFSKYLVQEYCPGAGVGVEVLMHGSEPRLVFQHRRLAEHPVSGGVSVVAISEPPDAALTRMAVELLRALEWQGVAMVEFRHDQAAGRTALMEVNGRYWGSLGLSVACNVDFPYAQWAFDHGVTPPPAPASSRGLRARWTVGVLSNLADAAGDGSPSGFWRALRNGVRQLSPSVRDMLFSREDPVPALLEVAGFVTERMKAAVKSALRLVLPGALRSDLTIARAHGWRTALLLRRHRSRQPHTPEQLPQGLKRILFVCHGNIMRSVFAEHLFRQAILPGAGIAASSAGLFAKPGRPADPRAIETARRHYQLDLSSHSAATLDEQKVAEADAIFVMDRINEVFFLKRFPEAEARLFLLGEFSPEVPLRDLDISDPYEGTPEDVTTAARAIAAGISGILKGLNQARG